MTNQNVFDCIKPMQRLQTVGFTDPVVALDLADITKAMQEKINSVQQLMVQRNEKYKADGVGETDLDKLMDEEWAKLLAAEVEPTWRAMPIANLAEAMLTAGEARALVDAGVAMRIAVQR